MTVTQQKERMNRDLCAKIDQDIKEAGQAISTADVDTFLVK